MINLRNQKGSITLFVLISCMFFIASVTCVQIYMQSKQTAVDREYRQIKSNYEGNLLSETNLKDQYTKLSNLKNASITILKITKTSTSLTVEFTLSPTDLDIKTIKYGWGTGENVDTVTKWTYLEKESAKENMIAKTDIEVATEPTIYHLFIMLNDKTVYTPIQSTT